MLLNKRALGNTNLQVSELSLGGVFLSRIGGKEFGECKKGVLKALDQGVNYMDTAPMYGDGEEILGKILAEYHSPLIISTKLGAYPEPFLPQDESCLMKSVTNSLKLLKREFIDILMIHEPDRPGQFNWWTDDENFRGPVMNVLDRLKKEGVIKYTGLGGTTSHELARIADTGRFDVVLTAFNYSLLWREADIEIFPTAKKHGMGIIIGAPFQQGALAKRYDDEVKNGASWMSLSRRMQYLALYELLDEIRIPLPELGIRFVLSNPDISCVLTGVRSEQEVSQNIESALKGPLPKAVLARLNDIAAMVPFRPFEEPMQLPFERAYKGPGHAR
jgi:aryl-alcohol dehydrogenase-like predicted oxidoreductase